LRGGGCYLIPHYSALAITTALTLRAVFHLALRQTEGLIGSIVHLLGLDLAVPDHSTLSRRGETLPVLRPRSGSEPVHLLVDSTGVGELAGQCGGDDRHAAHHADPRNAASARLSTQACVSRRGR
jgi:hypothetical protein